MLQYWYCNSLFLLPSHHCEMDFACTDDVGDYVPWVRMVWRRDDPLLSIHCSFSRKTRAKRGYFSYDILPCPTSWIYDRYHYLEAIDEEEYEISVGGCAWRHRQSSRGKS